MTSQSPFIRPARAPRAPALVICALVTSALGACAHPVPFPSEGPDVGKRIVAERGVVAAGNGYASQAGLEMLRQGGNAVDAAVATAFALGVTEPMMSGLGAGGGLLFWDAKRHRAEYLDFYSASGAIVDTALRALGTNTTPRGVGIPGAVRGLLDAQAKYGKLDRAAVMAPAIKLASEGFTVSALLAREIIASTDKLNSSAGARRLFLPDGKPLRAGDQLVQPELAATMRRIASEGAAVFYSGEIGEHIVATLRNAGSTITRADFSAYQPRWTRPVCTTYEGRVVLSAAAPQSGVQVVEALNLLAGRDLPAKGLPSRSPDAFRAVTGALRVAVTDRDAIIGDPVHVAVPQAGATSMAFAATRSREVDGTVTGPLTPGNPWSFDRDPSGECADAGSSPAAKGVPRAASTGEAGDGAMAETTHMSVVDAEGNAVSVTNTLGLGFGTGTWVDGVFLNSALFNFSRNASSPNAPGPNRVSASTIAPTILLKNGEVEIVVGCPGSPAIPPAIVQTIVYLLDYKLDPLQALRMPRMIPTTGAPLRMEQGFAAEVYGEARRLGYEVTVAPPTDMGFGGVHVIARRSGRWVGAADPRRDGEVRGW
jgi:gamma-glutamyltranspeptidase/glutathione hydrolase